MWHQHRAIVKDSMGVCDWKYPVIRIPSEDWSPEAEEEIGDVGAEALLFRACTGIDMDIDQMHRPIAERVVNLERCIEVRNNGRSRELDEAVIPHFQWPEKTDGTHLSADANEFRELLDRYYDLRGWDRVRGWPTRQKLLELGLEEAAATLDASREQADRS
jgi:aldehyde:ferredoxin oxidoreductase